MKNHLFLFTISPVQSFIANARKTRDLYAGSHILSEMTKAAAKEAINQNIDLVFPTNTSGKSFPNRFVGKLQGVFSDEKLEDKGKAIKDKVIETFDTITNEALSNGKIKTTPTGFWKQINNQWDVNWLFYPYEEGQYEAAYAMIEPLMVALKNQRVIKNDFVEAGRKCSLDGQNNALFRGKGTTNSFLKKQAVEVDNTWLKPNEGLSAVSLVKRAYSKGEKFPSTIEVALKKQLEQLDKTVKDCYKVLFSDKYPKACITLLTEQYIEKIKLHNKNDNWTTSFNEEFWIEDNLTEKNIPNLTQLSIVREVHQRYLKPHLKDRYYALIAFDGDKMGKLLSGATRKDTAIPLEDFQGKVSKLLMEYSEWIGTYEKTEKKIEVVYAGGDDFLGFVNLNDLFEVGKRLRLKFDEMVNQKLRDDITEDFTFSMGVTIAHYKTPLSIVLQTTREMEKLAKNENKGDRDAFAIAVLKHSGENHKAYYKWDVANGLPSWNALEKLVEHLQNDCSETFIRVLEREFSTLQNEKGKIKNPKMIKTELFRLANRSLNNDKKALTAKLTNETWKLFPISEDELEEDEVNVKNALSAMKVTLFLKRKTAKAS